MLQVILVTLVLVEVFCQPQLNTFKISSSSEDYFSEEENRCEGTNATVPLSCGVVPRINTRNFFLHNDYAAFGEFPWQVAILDAYEQRFLCSGVLLSHKTVLTAAQCVSEIPTTDLRVRLGDWDIMGNKDPREVYQSFEVVVAKKLFNPDAGLLGDRENGLSNIALLKIRKYSRWAEHPHVSPVCLPAPDLEDKLPTLHCVVGGWSETPLRPFQVLLEETEPCATGRMAPSSGTPQEACHANNKQSNSEDVGLQSRILGKALTHVVSRDDCLQITNEVTPREASTLCLFPVHDNSHPCQADVGAPVLCEVPAELRGGKRNRKIHQDDLPCQMVVVGVVTSIFSCTNEAILDKSNPVIATSILKLTNYLCSVAGTTTH